MRRKNSLPDILARLALPPCIAPPVPPPLTGAELTAWMRHTGITAHHLANHLGVTPKTVWSWGRSGPRQLPDGPRALLTSAMALADMALAEYAAAQLRLPARAIPPTTDARTSYAGAGE